MPNTQQILTKSEIQLLETLGIDPNSEKIQDQIQDLLNKGEIKVCEDCDQGGISKAVNWRGGGDFVYCELHQFNQRYIDLIHDAKDSKKLLKIWKEMQDKAFLDYRIETANFDEESFTKLSLEEQKELLISVLDKNMLYTNYSEIDDENMGISEEDKKINKEFYGEK